MQVFNLNRLKGTLRLERLRTMIRVQLVVKIDPKVLALAALILKAFM